MFGETVGILSQPTGRMRFEYVNTASRSLSVSMPIRAEAYGHEMCEAYFGNLLPESDESKRMIGLRFGANPNSTFSLLAAIGYDCAGAVSLQPLDEPQELQEWHELTCEPLTSQQLIQHITQLPRHPLLAGVGGIRLSLAGAQDKAAVCMSGSDIALPTAGTPTSHILKPAIAGFEDTVANEFFIMRLAQRVGLPTASVELRRVGDISFLLVERYDRSLSSDGAKIRRIHQEDFCQASAIRASSKYQNRGGPGIAQCFDLLNKTVRPAIARNYFARATIFNFLVGNRDAHAKNFALLHEKSLGFAPLYDLVSTGIYRALDSDLAMSVGGKYDPADVFPRHWQRTAEESRYSFPALRKSILELCERLPDAAMRLSSELADEQQLSPVYKQIYEFIAQTCSQTERRFRTTA